MGRALYFVTNGRFEFRAYLCRKNERQRFLGVRSSSNKKPMVKNPKIATCQGSVVEETRSASGADRARTRW